MEKVFLNSLIDFADWYKKSNLFIKKEKSYLHNCNTSNWNNVFIIQSWLNCKHMIITELVWVWTLDCFHGNRTGSKGILLSDGNTEYNVYSCGCSNKQAQVVWGFFLGSFGSCTMFVFFGGCYGNEPYKLVKWLLSVLPDTVCEMSMTISWGLGGLQEFAEFLYKRFPSLPRSLSSVIKWEVNKKEGGLKECWVFLLIWEIVHSVQIIRE